MANPAASSRPKVSLTKKGEGNEPRAAAPAPAPTPGRVDAMALILSRNDFYQVNAERALLIVLGQFVLIAALVAVILRLFDFTNSRDYYFPVRTDNTLILEKSLADPVYTDEQIKAWAEKAVTRTLTFGYYDHLLRLQNSRIYFTTKGWATFTQALTDAQILERMNAVHSEAVQGRNMVLASTLRGGRRAVISNQGIIGWYYTWQVELRINAAFLEDDKQTSAPWKVNILIIRVPAAESREGIGIDQLVAMKDN
jgi:hypothetical protein